MIAAARRTAAQRASRNARFEVARADALPFPADSFDAVISRFGIMFFPAPLDALREMMRVLKPGKRLALAVWYLAEKNPFLSTAAQILAEYIDSPPPEEDAPDTYRFAAPGKLRNLLAAAGAEAPSERLFRFHIEAPVSAEQFWTLRCEMSEKLRDAMAALSAQQVAEVKARCIEAIRAYSVEGGMRMPAEVVIVSAAKGNGSTQA